MKEFLIENYSWLASLLLSFLSLLVVSLRKLKVEMKDTPFEELLRALPSFIILAEKSKQTGSEKKQFVIGLALEYLAKLTGKDAKDLGCYIKRISDAIENILSTPAKKGEINEVENKS